MDKFEEIKKVCDEIYNCSRCAHMKSAGYTYVTDKFGNSECLPFRPFVPDYKNENTDCNYELMSIGINPGYDPSQYKQSDYNFSDINRFKEICNKEYKPSRYDIQSMRDFYHITNVFSGDKYHYINNRTRNILIESYNNPKNKDNKFYDAVYWGNVVFCPSNSIHDGTVNSNNYIRTIDIKYNYYMCKQYILRIANIIHPKAICVYCASIIDALNRYEDIVDFFSYQENNEIKYLFKNANNEFKLHNIQYGSNKRRKKIDYCLAKYCNNDICAIFFLKHPIRDGGDRWDRLEDACKKLMNELYNY